MKLEFPTRNYNCSDKYKIIFIHVPRTGGGTINNLLEIPREDQGHRAPWEIRLSIDPGKWEEYDKVVMCRNPWDRMVSLYKYRMKRGYDSTTKFDVSSFGNWVVNPEARKFSGELERESVWSIINITNNEIIKNHDTFSKSRYKLTVIPFETMCDSWVTWCLKTDREELADKAHNHFKTTFINKTERKNYKEYYDDFTKVMVYSQFQMDEFMWGYNYDEGGKPSFEQLRTSIANNNNVPIDRINDRYVLLDVHGDKSYNDKSRT